MECVGNLYSPFPLHEQPKGEFINVGSDYVCMPIALLLEGNIL